MDPQSAVSQLQSRKRDLLLESDINRQILRLECEKVRVRIESWTRNWDRVQGIWKWLAPVAGFVFARRFSKTAGAFTAASGWLPLLRKVWDAWRGRRSMSEHQTR